MKKIQLLFFLCLVSLSAQEQKGNVITLEKYADSLYYVLSNQYSDKNYIKALDLRNAILLKHTDTTTKKHKVSLAKKHALRAIYLGHKQEYDSAIVNSKKALKIIGRLKKHNLFLVGHIYMHLYEQLAYSGDWDTSYELTKKTLQIFKDTLPDNHKLIADVEFDIGYAAGHFGDYFTSIKQYEISRDKYISFMGENNHELALKHYNLATVYGFVGFYRKELESYKSAIKVWETIDYEDKSYLSIAYGSMNIWYLQHGEYKKAEQYLIKKEKLIQNKKGEKWFNETYKGRTQVELWLGYSAFFWHKKDTVNALLYTDMSLNYLNTFNVSDKRNNPNNVPYMEEFFKGTQILILRKKANLIKHTQPKKAKELFEEVIRLINQNNENLNILPDKISIAQYYINRKEYQKASNVLNDIDFKVLKRKSDFDFMHLFAEQANLKILQNNIVDMNLKYQQVFKLMQQDSLKIISLKNLRYKDCKPYGTKKYLNIVLKASNNYSKIYTKTKTHSYLKIAHNLNLLASEMFDANYASLNYNEETYNTVIKINEQLLGTTLLLKDETIFDGIIQKIEQSSSKLSWKKFLNSNQRKYINIPDSILENEDDLKKQLHFYKKQLFTSNESDNQKTKLWKEKIFDLQEEIDLLNVWYQNNYKSYFNQTLKPFDLKFLKAKLKKEQKIIKYIFTEEKIYAFTISTDSTQLYFIANKTNLFDKLKTLIKSLSKNNSNDFRLHAQDVYKLLLPSQVIDTHNKQELIFILDDILHYLPMEILVDIEGKYLIEKHAISYASSLLLWNEEMQSIKSKNNKLGVFAPTYNGEKTNKPKRGEASDLLGASNEAVQIAKLFNANVFSGSKQEFIKNSKAYSILHLAMHATINNTDSEFSHLAFPSNQDDNKLFISELYNMTLNANLAVLSACNTSVGNLEKGKGLINVSRAFTYAGVPSTVTSLWKVPDKETSQIMISFYKYLKKGGSKNKALQLAKLDYLSSTDDNTLKHPYYWAGFVVSGDISPIISSTSYQKYILGIAMLVLVVYFFRKRYVNIYKN